MRTAEDHGVDVRFAQRRAVGAYGLDDPVIEREALLDDRRQIGAGDARQCRRRERGRARRGRRLRSHRRGRREQADPPVARPLRGDPRFRLDDADHLDAERRREHPLAQRIQRRRARRVAGDDEQLARRASSNSAIWSAKLLELRGAALAVGKARGVAEVEEVLVRELDEQLLQDGQPADAGVEDGDRTLAGRARGPWTPRAMIPDGLPLVVSRARAGCLEHGGSRERPGRGVFVRDQVAALRRIDGVEVELFEFRPGALSYPLAARRCATATAAAPSTSSMRTSA